MNRGAVLEHPGLEALLCAEVGRYPLGNWEMHLGAASPEKDVPAEHLLTLLGTTGRI